MEPSLDVLATLEAKSTETSVEELAKRGKKRLRVIRAKDIAWMVQSAVERAFASSDWVPPDQVAELRQKAEAEFAELRRSREAELRSQADRQRALEAATRDRDARSEELAAARRRAEELEARVRELETANRALEDRAQTREGAQAWGGQGPGESASALFMMRMMDEIQGLKSQVRGSAEPQDDGVAALLEEKLASIAGSVDARLEKLGKGMGVSAAIDTGEIDFEGLLERTIPDGDLESNIDTVDVQKREGTGIAANLERIKKLKGGLD